ncbi:MAG: polyprenyl synthetase family protein, partial [Candidatus Promineifilaceae bacterium]|nr:polyprenyl synthetase family protein [Candidatus Promineifilaceae bacterium]
RRPTRRGRQTVWKVWGEAQAINTGDAMFAIAHLALSRLSHLNVPPTTVLHAVHRFDETCLRLTQGQHMDMDFETRDEVGVDEYINMITGKTAVLLSYCTEVGAIVAGRDERTIDNYAAFGLNLGLAFQVIDDILGIWGDESRTGKSAATDITTKKKTLPVLFGLERSAELRELYLSAPADRQFMDHVVATLDALGARQYASDIAAEYSTAALSHLKETKPGGEAGMALFQLADMLLQRDF